MTPVTRVLALPVLLAASVALAACGTGGDQTADEQGATTPVATGLAAAPDGDDASAGACPTVPQEGYELFSSDAVTSAPADGAVYGDGSLIAWTIASPPEYAVFDIELSYVNTDGDAIPFGGFFLDDLGNGEWGSNFNVFASDAHGRPGLAVLGMTWDTSVSDTGEITGNHEILGVYCLSLVVAE